MVWCRDQHRINILRLEQVFVELEPLGIGGHLRGFINAGAEDITERGRVDGRILDEGPQDPATSTATADQAHVHFFVCAQDAGVRSGSEGSCGLEQCTAFNQGRHARESSTKEPLSGAPEAIESYTRMS